MTVNARSEASGDRRGSAGATTPRCQQAARRATLLRDVRDAESVDGEPEDDPERSQHGLRVVGAADEREVHVVLRAAEVEARIEEEGEPDRRDRGLDAQ